MANETTHDALFREVVSKAGGISNLGRALGDLPRQTVNHWRYTGFPPAWCASIAAITGIPVHRLRPDDWQKFWPDARKRKAA